MSEATGRIQDPRRRESDTGSVPLPRLGRPDLLLALIPLAFAVALVAAATSALAVTEAVAIAALFGSGAILESVVVNPPTTGR